MCIRDSGVVDNAEKVNGLTVLTAVPANAKFQDTIYTHPTSSGNKHIPSGGASGPVSYTHLDVYKRQI